MMNIPNNTLRITVLGYSTKIPTVYKRITCKQTILVGVYLMTTIFAATIGNNAAAALAFPFAVGIAGQTAVRLPESTVTWQTWLSFIPFVGRPDWSNKYLLLASQGFVVEKLRRKPRSLRIVGLNVLKRFVIIVPVIVESKHFRWYSKVQKNWG